MSTTTVATADALRDLKARIRQRSNDQEPERSEAGYCRHGRYVGGMGIDWICQACEDGTSLHEEVDDYVDGLVTMVRDVLDLERIIDRVRNRIGFETPVTSSLRQAHQKLCFQVWEDADLRAVYQILWDAERAAH